jgi:hypothetical protein
VRKIRFQGIHTQAHPVLSKENLPTYGGEREQGKGWSS